MQKKTTARTIITGVYYKEGNNLQFYAHVVDAENDEILNAVGPVSGPAGDPLKTIEILRQKILGALAANFDEKFKNYSDRILNPPLFDAYKEFLFGVDLFFKGQYENAFLHYIKSIELDTNYYTPLLWACGSLWNNATYELNDKITESINEYRKFDSLTYFLEKHRSKLTQGEQYHLDWLIGFREGDPERILKAARNASPYYLIFEYEQALDALNANRPQVTIEVLSKLEPDLLHFPGWYWSVMASAYHMIGEYEKELKIAQKGSKKYPELFGSFYNETTALSALGKTKEIDQKLNESLTLPEMDGWNTGWLMLGTAQELRAHGFPEEAMKVSERCIEWCNAHMANEVREILAEAFYVAERWDESQKLFELLSREKPGKSNIMDTWEPLLHEKGK